MGTLGTLVVETERLHIAREFTFGDHLELIRMKNPETGVEYVVMTRADFEALLSETVAVIAAHPDVAKLFDTPKTNKRTATKTKAKAKSVKASLKPTTRAKQKLAKKAAA